MSTAATLDKPSAETIIKPYRSKKFVMTFKTHSLSANYSVTMITEALGGIKPEVYDFDDPDYDGDFKVSTQWEFLVNGKFCSIWDYKDHRWSVYDPEGVLGPVFGALPEA